jgi:hypothetical protein
MILHFGRPPRVVFANIIGLKIMQSYWNWLYKSVYILGRLRSAYLLISKRRMIRLIEPNYGLTLRPHFQRHLISLHALNNCMLNFRLFWKGTKPVTYTAFLFRLVSNKDVPCLPNFLVCSLTSFTSMFNTNYLQRAGVHKMGWLRFWHFSFGY